MEEKKKKLVMIGIRKKGERGFKITQLGHAIDKPIAALVNMGVAGLKGADAAEKFKKELEKHDNL